MPVVTNNMSSKLNCLLLTSGFNGKLIEDYQSCWQLNYLATIHMENQSIYWDIVSNSVPLILSNVFENIVENINMKYATDDNMMAGIGMATILIHCIGGSLIVGFRTGYTNFASRAYGARNKDKFKQAFVQGTTNLCVLLALFLLLALGSSRVINLTKQADAIAEYSHRTLLYYLPGLFLLFISDFLWSYLNSQKVFKPTITIFIIGVLVHIGLSATVSKSYGFMGMMISTNITYLLVFLMTLYVVFTYGTWPLCYDMLCVSEPYSQYRALSRGCFNVAIPTCLNQFILQFMTLYLGTYQMVKQTAANVAIANLLGLMEAPQLGFANYVMTRIGHFIGKNKPDKIKEISRTVIILSIGTIYSILIVVYIFRKSVANHYFNDHLPDKYFFLILNLLFLKEFFSAVKTSIAYILRALGYGNDLVKMNIVSFYLIGIGLMVVLTQKMEKKILALWISLCIGEVIMASLVMWWLWSIDIEQKTLEIHNEVKIKELAAEDSVGK